MKRTFIQQLDTITKAAHDVIESICTDRKTITILHTTGSMEFEEEQKWLEDVFGEVPTFTYYSLNGEIEYAAVKEIKLEGDQVHITGILKYNSYPDEILVNLLELDSTSSCELADYLLSLNDTSKE